jgi:hypothetical protein
MHALAQDPLAMAERMVSHAQMPAIPAPSPAALPVIAALGGDAATVSTMARQEIRGAIMAAQEYLCGLSGAQRDCPVTHHFAPGSYAREMTIPAGVIIIGKIHRHAHINVISKGRVRVVTEAGAETFEAPHTFVSEQGTKRVVFAESETVWTTVHVIDETDLDKIEGAVIADSYEELGIIDAQPQQGGLK